jgi:hypothetical protein
MEAIRDRETFAADCALPDPSTVLARLALIVGSPLGIHYDCQIFAFFKSISAKGALCAVLTPILEVLFHTFCQLFDNISLVL